MTILVSACLLGLCTRYDGKAKINPETAALGASHTLIPVCPEQLGGLATPRVPAERRGDGRVLTRDGADVTENFRLGARMALDIFSLSRCDIAVLKARSPSCGRDFVYDGFFSGRLVPGAGVFAQMLLEKGVRVLTEEDTDQLQALA